ncbi:MAG: hypothetical protein RR910_08670, partial [Acidaminococcaceae bacterium]
GGPAAGGECIDKKWLERWGNLLGLSVNDLIGTDGLKKQMCIPYSYPSDEELAKVGVTGLYLGYYLPWDSVMNTIVARGFGLTTFEHAIEGSTEDAGNTDDYRMGVHHYFKYLKYGYSRASDIVSQDIRAGRLVRSDGVELVKRNDGKFPNSYLGKSLKDILKPLGLNLEEFIAICDRYTNKEYFQLDKNGKLIRD